MKSVVFCSKDDSQDWDVFMLRREASAMECNYKEWTKSSALKWLRHIQKLVID